MIITPVFSVKANVIVDPLVEKLICDNYYSCLNFAPKKETLFTGNIERDRRLCLFSIK